MDLNKVTLIGNMVRDPESRSLRTGQTITKFSLATNYAWQDAKTKAKKEAVDFHDIIAWGKLGEIISQYVKKGSKLYVEGRLRNRAYQTKDGQKRTAKEIVADNMIMLGHRTAKTGDPVSKKLVKEDVDVEEVDLRHHPCTPPQSPRQRGRRGTEGEVRQHGLARPKTAVGTVEPALINGQNKEKIICAQDY